MFRLARPLLLILLTYQLVVQAADIGPHEEAPTSCVDGCSKRTLFDIIWGCVSTTIICAWAAIHPNIPPQEGPVKGTLRRLELMFWTIVAPEILPAWALNQRLAAVTIRDLYNKEKGYERLEEKRGVWKTLKGWFSFYEIKEAASDAWTMKHAHFLIMGGFHLVEPVEGNSTSPEVATTGNDLPHLNVQAQATNTPSVEEGTSTDAENGRVPSGNRAEVGRVTILTLELLQGLVQDPEFGIQITEKEIADKSKGDGLTKIILIFQSSWFMLQCIARYVQGLSLTQLELTTLALASLNGITFILWWDKPLGVQAPMRVYLKRKLTEAERDVGRQRGSSARSWFVSAFIATVSGPNPFGIVIRAVLREPWSILLLPFAIYVLLVLPIVVFLFSIITTYSDLLGQSSFPADATHVPTFYVPKHRYPKYLHVLLLIALATTFGAIHCAGWNLSFPTHTGQKLWRVTSLAVTIVPIAALPATLISFIVVSPILITIVLIIGTIARRLGLSNFVLDLRSSIVNSIVSLINSIVRLPLAIVISSFDQDQISVLAFSLINYMLLYASARLVLLGLAVALLKHQPDSAFIAVDWTMFYPHTS